MGSRQLRAFRSSRCGSKHLRKKSPGVLCSFSGLQLQTLGEDFVESESLSLFLEAAEMALRNAEASVSGNRWLPHPQTTSPRCEGAGQEGV